MAINEIHINDVGTRFEVQVRDNDNAIVDISPSGMVPLYQFKKPDNTYLNKTPSLQTDGTDGWLVYVAQDGDLDLAGLWRFQVYVTLPTPSGNWHSDIGTFRVYPNL
ncbi:MAG: hypothetical protein K2R98_19520 [Gemmataceae bacterium]|nr:hypothetical protein [Gemmataceae bacterium]